MRASHMVSPRVGHMEQVLHIFSYLKSHHNTKMVFDPGEPDFDIDTTFPREDWSDTVYGEVQEELPHEMLEVRGSRFNIAIYVDSDHASDNLTQ